MNSPRWYRSENGSLVTLPRTGIRSCRSTASACRKEPIWCTTRIALTLSYHHINIGLPMIPVRLLLDSDETFFWPSPADQPHGAGCGLVCAGDLRRSANERREIA